MKNNCPVVVFNDFIAAYGAIRSLGPYDIPIYVVSRSGKGLATKSRFVRHTLALMPNDPNFIRKLNVWLKKEVGEEAVLMVAGEDEYLDVLAKGCSDLSYGIRKTFPDWEIVKLVREKRRTYKIAEELGIPTPKTYYITCQAELKNLLDKEIEGRFPLLMKSEDSARLLTKYKTKGIICNNHDEVFNNYKKYNGFFEKLLLQEMAPGGENLLFNFITVLNSDSEPISVFMNRKRRSSEQFLSCTLMESMWSDEVLAYSLKLLKKIGYTGYANTEFKFDRRDGLLKFLEINGRISMSNSHALRCGINLPLLMYKEALEGPLPKQNKLIKTYPNNILWWYLKGDTLSAISLIKKKELSIKDYLKSIKGNGYIIEPLNWNDLLPAIYSIKDYFSSKLNKIKRLI